jgi:hypothetical protein
MFLHCWFFYNMESNFFSTTCVVSNYYVFVFFVGFWVLWLQPHKHHKCNYVLQGCIPCFFLWILFVLLCALILMSVYFVLWNLEFIAKLVLFLIIMFLCFLQVSQFCDCNHTNIASAIVSCKDVYLVFLIGFICFVVCIDFDVGLFCFAESGVHF